MVILCMYYKWRVKNYEKKIYFWSISDFYGAELRS